MCHVLQIIKYKGLCFRSVVIWCTSRAALPLLLHQDDDDEDTEEEDDVDSDSVVPGIDNLLRIKPISAWVAISLDGGSRTIKVAMFNDVSHSITCFDVLLLFVTIGVASLSIDD